MWQLLVLKVLFGVHTADCSWIESLNTIDSVYIKNMVSSLKKKEDYTVCIKDMTRML